jgi:hypothetical protein
MGLISQLVLLPVAPLRFSVWVADKVAEEVEREEFSAGAGVRKLEEIQQARERGEISEEEAGEAEGRILEQQMSAPTLSKRGQGLDNG